MIKHLDNLIILPTAFVLISFLVMAAIIFVMLIALMRKEDALERLRARHYHGFKRAEETESYEYISKIKRYGEEIFSSKDDSHVSSGNT